MAAITEAKAEQGEKQAVQPDDAMLGMCIEATEIP
jgi:hypothetical protein